jgi:dipeptidyl aminopeptidase/acylaminoacyl peptidase
VGDLLKRSDDPKPLSPVWVVDLSTYKEGPIISEWRWLADSSGVAFLQRVGGRHKQLVLADLQKKTIEPLTPSAETIKAFDIRDRQHYVYTVADESYQERVQAERQATAVVGTDRTLFELLLPELVDWAPRTYLWAVAGGEPFAVKRDSAPFVFSDFGYEHLALSPDGRSLLTTLPVAEVPLSWETQYPPPDASSPHGIHAGHQDVRSGMASVLQYVRIDLQTGSVQALTDGPIGSSAGWEAYGDASWSSDGKEILLPNIFIKSTNSAISRPCVAVLDLSSNTPACVQAIKRRGETGFLPIRGAEFAGGDKQGIRVIFMNRDESYEATEYQRVADGTWQVAGQIKGGGKAEHNGVEITVKEGVNDPPLLVAVNKQASRVLWDPNPQLKNFGLGEAAVYTWKWSWKDKERQEGRGGLYKPVNYKPGQRYPLVIQTHGFSETRFSPSGVFPTAFAARALAAEGIAVLQVGAGGCPGETPDEGPCAVSYYESAVKQLISDGLVDPDKIGIIGFSRTCFTVMETLTMGSLHLKAASITDGVMAEYVQYMLASDKDLSQEYDSMIGAPAFGEGLQQWLKRSPGFNLDKINAPLLVVGSQGPWSLLFMWQPYAGLHYLKKPVELVMLHTHEHVLTNPAARVASQGGTVDWFRFWLQDYEDPDPTKAEQYTRWHQLRNLQEQNDKSK